MPTISQLPEASNVDPADLLVLDQSGQSVAITTALLLQGTQARLSLSPGNLLGRVSSGSGGPEPVGLGAGLIVQNGTLAIDTKSVSFTSSGDLSSASVLAPGTTTPRNLARRAGDRLNVLDFGADPTGVADSTSAFVAACSAVATGGTARVWVPRGTYIVTTAISQPNGSSIAVEFDEGAKLTGGGSLNVARVDSSQGAFQLSRVAGGFSGFPVGVGNVANLAFDTRIVENNPTNSGAARVGWSYGYTNQNRYSKYSGGTDAAEQRVSAWPRLFDGTSALGRSDIITAALIDEDTASRSQLSGLIGHSEVDVVNNGPDYGWTCQPGTGTPVQGMAIDPWALNGIYGGHVLYAYGTAGSYDGAVGGINQRWISYPAVHSAGNPPVVPQGSTITLSLDLNAKATATVTAGGWVGSVTVTSGGGAYTSAPAIVFSGGGGSGASGSAVMLAGSVVAVTVTSVGSGYTSSPNVTFSGGGVAAAVTNTITLNSDGLHGDLASVAAAIRGGGMAMVTATVSTWGGVVSRLVVFAFAPSDLGILTLGGSALASLGILPQSYRAPRDDTAVVLGTTARMTLGDVFTINGSTVTIGGLGAPADVAAAVNKLAMPGLIADVTASGRTVLTAWLPQQPAGIVLGQPVGSTALAKIGLSPGTFLPPTPPKAFATAMGEAGPAACKVSDVIRIGATDLAGTAYGPVLVTLSGGGGSGSVADVVASVRTALQGAGFYSNGFATLTNSPSVVAVYARNAGVGAALVIRNTAGGTITLANVSGTPLDTLGLIAGTYQPGGYSAGSQTVFHAAPNSLSPQGRGVFVGGSSVPDRTVWPNTPMEVRGNFAHGFRTDRASFGDGVALVLGSGQSIGWGLGGPSLAITGGTLTSSAPASMPSLLLTSLASSPAGLPAGAIWNNGGVLSIV